MNDDSRKPAEEIADGDLDQAQGGALLEFQIPEKVVMEKQGDFLTGARRRQTDGGITAEDDWETPRA